MQRAVDVVVTGFTKSPVLPAKSLAPLRRLQQDGMVRHIHCVTWDSPQIDAYAAALGDVPGVTVTRLPQPETCGNGNQRGLVYQLRNLEAGLALLPREKDALVLKWRPDFVAEHAFLRDKLLDFENWSAVPDSTCFGVKMPPALFGNRLWLPWADSNSPFFFEDAVFLGTQRDVANMVTPVTPGDLEILGDAACGSYAHVVRYAKPFLPRYPLLGNYLRHFRYFRHDVKYRHELLPFMIHNGFFWHLLVANAWVLHSQFHVDSGAPGDLAFYANAVNRRADWSDFSGLQVSSPYDDIAQWRAGSKAGLAVPSISRAFGRLVDDGWQKALLTGGTPDMPQGTLAPLMENIARCRDGRLAGIEAEFYQGVERIYRAFPPHALAG
jgi:hypothetical protein